jgi:hypothetical protein
MNRNAEPENCLDEQDLKSEVIGFVARPVMFPDERQGDFDALRDALLREMDPSTPYETALACNIANLEWNAARERRLRNRLLKATYVRIAGNILRGGEIQPTWSNRSLEDVDKTDVAKELEAALTGDDEDERRAAQTGLAQRGYSPDDVVALAYQECAAALDLHERRLTAI